MEYVSLRWNIEGDEKIIKESRIIYETQRLCKRRFSHHRRLDKR